MSGTFTETGIVVLHPNGKSTFQGIRSFTGTVNGQAGSFLIKVEGTGGAVPTDIQGHFTLMGGTGALSGLHGEGTFVGTGPGTDDYTGRFHFDP
jgi:hypothetical protein